MNTTELAKDRELLELAAKAAGVAGTYQNWTDSRDNVSCGIAPNGSTGSQWWNPLRDDGAALRLALKLHMGLQSNGPDHWQSPDCTIVLFDGPVCGHRLTQQHNSNPEAATRRAIVRAAAEIGRSLTP